MGRIDHVAVDEHQQLDLRLIHTSGQRYPESKPPHELSASDEFQGYSVQ